MASKAHMRKTEKSGRKGARQDIATSTTPSSSPARLSIGCDIGGVVKEMNSNQPLPGALPALAHLQLHCDVVFVSKCSETYSRITREWLSENSLEHVPIFFCEDYEGKLPICAANRISIMIDDKIKVLKFFPATFTKIWLCDDDQKIMGLQQHDPMVFQSVQLARSWSDVLSFLSARFSVPTTECSNEST